MKHKTEDYKISAVKYYLETPNSMDAVCDIFGCKIEIKNLLHNEITT